MTQTLTYAVLDGAGAPRTGVAVTATPYDGNRYPPKNVPTGITATTNGSGVATLSLPDVANARGQYYRLSGPGITTEPIVLIKPGVSSTTVTAAQTGSVVAGKYIDVPNALSAPLASPAVAGTAYRNSARRTVQVSVAYTPTGAGSVVLSLSRDGSTFTPVDSRAYTAAGAQAYLAFGLPAGHSYKLAATGATLGAVVSF